MLPLLDVTQLNIMVMEVFRPVHLKWLKMIIQSTLCFLKTVLYIYNELVSKVQSMDSWIPNRYSYRTIKGWVHKEPKYVHIDESLF